MAFHTGIDGALRAISVDARWITIDTIAVDDVRNEPREKIAIDPLETPRQASCAERHLWISRP